MTTRDKGGAGSNEVFRSLYDRYYARMLRYFQRVFRMSFQDAQDSAHDSFIRLFKTMDEYRGEAEWALLETIARNVAYNRARSLATLKRGAVKPESLDDPEFPRKELEPVQTHPVDRLIEKERTRRLIQAIETLPKKQQRCLRLWLEDHSYQQIADILRTTVDGVKSRIRDAKKLLRERLGAEGVLPEE